jgi:hypothetical protein
MSAAEDISAALPDVAVSPAQRQFNALPVWAKPLVAGQDMLDLAVNGITLGLANNAAAGIDSLMGRGSYEDRLAVSEQRTAEARERAGWAGTAAEIGGTMVPASALAKSALSATRMVPAALSGTKGLIARSLAMGSDGALLGTIQATGNDTDPVTGALLGLAGGAGGNLAGEAITAGASKALGAFNKPVPTMTAEELKAAGTAAYGRAKDAGVVFKPEAVGKLRDDVYKDMAEFAWDPRLQPGADVVFDRLGRLAEGGNVGLEGLESVRKIAGNAYNPTNPSNNELLRQITQRVDDFAAKAGPDDILMGNAKVATDALKEGRDYWSRFRKLEKVDELLDRAGLNAGSAGSGGNIENASRQQLKRILTDKKMMRGFTTDEKDAIRKAVLGTPGQNTLRLLGKLSPQGGGLMAALGTGFSFANPWIGLPAMALAAGAKKGSEAMTSRNAELVKKLIAAGGSKSALEGPKNALQRLAESQREPLIRALMASGLVAAGQQ